MNKRNTIMVESIAYPCDRTYSERLATKYAVGDAVLVGPAYRAGCELTGSEYFPDGHEGMYYVVKCCPVGPGACGAGEYLLSPNRGGLSSDFFTIYMYATRLTDYATWDGSRESHRADWVEAA